MNRVAKELAWFVFMAVITVLLQVLATFEPEKVADWRAWAVGVGVQLVRAGAAAALTWLAKHAAGGSSTAEGTA